MKERPIIFSTEMVKAILDGRKTMTRRVIKPQPYIVAFDNIVPYKLTGELVKRECESCHHPLPDGKELTPIKCPYGQVGDRLWVRETWAIIKENDNVSICDMSQNSGLYYKANNPTSPKVGKWRSSIFMPRWASRLTLEITEVRVERLQEISREDIRLEGVVLPPSPKYTPREFSELHQEFVELWNELNAKRGYPFDFNPWVWVIKFYDIGMRIK